LLLESRKTDKNPNEKMEKTSIFWFEGIVRLYRHGSGMAKMLKSMTMFRADEKYQIGKVLRHLPAMLGTIVAIGMQDTPSRTACTTVQSSTK
jgi:hypothetical protein